MLAHTSSLARSKIGFFFFFFNWKNIIITYPKFSFVTFHHLQLLFIYLFVVGTFFFLKR
jgi:hypothetical protein